VSRREEALLDTLLDTIIGRVVAERNKEGNVTNGATTSEVTIEPGKRTKPEVSMAFDVRNRDGSVARAGNQRSRSRNVERRVP
jgi:hypothetical protein